MKKLILIGAVLVAAVTSFGQSIITDGYTTINDIVAGPWGVAGGYGKSLSSHGGTAAFAVVSYNLVPSTNGMGFNSGPIAGYDVTYVSHSANRIYSLSGGWDASWTGRPFGFVGKTFVTNIVGNAMVFQLLATPKGGSVVGAITGTAVTLDVYDFWGFHLKPIGIYESRNGMAGANGNWLFGGLGLTHLF